MATLLHIDVSANIQSSVSRMLSAEFVKQWKEKNPNDTVEVLDLAKNPVPMIDTDHLVATWGDDAALTEGQRQSKADSARLVDQLVAADAIVIGSPVYNLFIPAGLKAYIDQVVIAGKTFQYGANGPMGLLHNKKAFVLFASGSPVEGLNAAGLNFFEPYMKAILGFIGIESVTTMCVAARTREAAAGELEKLKPQIAAAISVQP